MAQAQTDKFMKGGISTLTTLAAPGKALAASSINVGSTTNWPTDTGKIIAIWVVELVDGEYEEVAGTYTEWSCTHSGTTVNDLTLEYGTDQVYAAGTTTKVAIVDSAKTWNRAMDGMTAEHNQSGGHTNVTVSGTLAQTGVATFATHIDVNDSSTAIRDSSDNELLKFAKTASAVNEVTVTNAATENAPQVSASGSDTNIDLRLVPKGTGNVKVGTAGGAIDWWEEIARTTLGSAGDTITVSSIPARNYLKIILRGIATGGTLDTNLRFNNDSGANYAYYQAAAMGAAGAAAVSQTGIAWESGATDSGSTQAGEVLIYSNVATTEKMFKAWSISGDATGGATAPAVIEEMGKWANASAQVNRIDWINSGTGDFAIGSEVIVLGHN